MRAIGYMGLGVMGHWMSANLIKKSGLTVYGFDPVPELRGRFAALGGKPVERADELYAACDLIFFCLPTNEIVQKTVREAITKTKPGQILVDMGSTSPKVIRELYAEALEKGIMLLDSPVSGGEQGAKDGSLVIMCGGARETFDAVKPYLDMMGKTVTYMGGAGNGSTAKVCNNMMVGIHLLAVGEAFSFAKKAGLDPKCLFDAIKDGFAESAVMTVKVPKILARDFSASARIAVHYKDIKNAMELAEYLGVALPLTAEVKAQMNWMDEKGMINEDQCALVKFYENAMQVEVIS